MRLFQVDNGIVGMAGALCGFSGGADSTALLLGLVQQHVAVKAVHFHHGLRGADADADAEWCRLFCERRGIPFQCVHLDVPQHRRPRESMEQCARRLRLEQWRKLSQLGKIPVFLGHHADDLMENLFLRAARGAGSAQGLLGMAVERVVENVRFIRPMLALRKTAIEKWLRQQGVPDWRLDGTNGECICRRNAVRNRLLPMWRQIFGNDAGLYRTVQNLLHPRTGEKCTPENAAEDVSDVKISLEPWEDIVWRWKENPVLPLGGWGGLRAEAIAENVSLLQAELSEAVRLNWRGVGETEEGESRAALYFERWENLPEVLTVRHWRPGDRLRPFGGRHSGKLQDFFTDAKVPRPLRLEWPVVVAGESIAWVPAVRRAECFRVMMR